MTDDALKKAEAAVREAEGSTDVARIVAAVLAAQAAQPPVPQPPAQQAKQRPVGLYVAAGLGGAVALSFLALAAAVLAVAVAVGAISSVVCLLVLRSIWQDIQRGR